MFMKFYVCFTNVDDDLPVPIEELFGTEPDVDIRVPHVGWLSDGDASKAATVGQFRRHRSDNS